MRKFIVTGMAVAMLAVPAAASASVTLDKDASGNPTGSGFVGKGDVQYTLGLNNAGLQGGTFAFTYQGTNVKVTEAAWECTNSKNEKLQQREQTTTTTNSTTALVSSIARVKNQITGFNLDGWKGAPVVKSDSDTDGPKLNSCPDESGNWTLTTPAGEPTIVSDTTEGGLYVNGTLLVSPPATSVA